MNQLFPLLHLEEVGAGGLFDFGATLPLLALQFVILTVVLNGLLYDPLLNTINDRNDYIVNNLSEASLVAPYKFIGLTALSVDNAMTFLTSFSIAA